MTSQEISLKLLNRTKFAQNRTRYYTVRNSVLSQTERPLFVTGSFNDCVGNLKLLSLRKSYLHRHSSKRGPFQKLSLPHEYFKILGEPAYYSHSELLYACSYASDNFMCDSYFWKQICEKIREVRDVIDIKDLLSCLCSIVKVNYYDRDLLRLLSREFVDDIDKLSLDDIHQLLHCYYKQNVYSCDLVDKVGLKVTQLINATPLTQNSENQSSTLFGKIKDLIPTNKSSDSEPKCELDLKTLSRISNYLSYFKYSNYDFHNSISNLFITYCNSMDFISRLNFFNSIDPKLLTNNLSTTNNLTNNKLINTFLKSIVNDSISFNHENSYELGTFLSSGLFKSAESSKLLHDFCSISSTIKLICNSILHLSRFDLYGTDVSDTQPPSPNQTNPITEITTRIPLLLERLYKYCFDIIDLIYQISSNYTAVKSPFIKSFENIFIDSILTCIRALNSFYRLQVLVPSASQNTCKLLSFTTDDNNVHSSFLKLFHRINITSSDLNFISKASQCLINFDCKGQSIPNLTSSFEIFSLIQSTNQSTELIKSIDILSLEIIRQLVDFDRESIYRIALTLNFTNTNSLLNHYISFFPKITRRKHHKHHITLNNL
uniref:Uncharacterized protein n=1 Tax=Theileria annulata TaxID=5874 RepID=A0A3B0MM80_THEAN